MSKKMWHKIFKSKAQKPPPLAKINKRHSRIVYEEYQQLNEKEQLNFSNEKENEHENGNENEKGPACGNGNGSINVFEQQPLQSSFNSLEFSEAQQQQQQQQHQPKQQQQQLSTFSRVRNTFSIRRSSNNSNSKKLANAKSSESDAASSAAATIVNATTATATATAATLATLTNNKPSNQLQRVLIVVNKIDVATNCPTNHLHANPTATTAIKSTIHGTTDPEAEDPMQGGADEDPQPPKPLTSGSSNPVPEYAPEQDTQLTPCPCCSRTFITSALRKHIVICEKSSKKRKVFESFRQRRAGTALSTYVLPKNFGMPNAERTAGLPYPPTNSREATSTAVSAAAAAAAAPSEPVKSPAPVRRKSQTEMVRSTARASLRKAASTLSSTSASAEAPSTGPPAAPPTAAPIVRERSLAKRIKAPACDRCPHCDRSFNPKAFDRHVEWCKEKAILATMKSTNTQETSKAKERLEARKQYRPPNLKTKRSLARDKYSGNHEELLEAGEMAAAKPSMMSLSMTSSVHSDNNPQAQVARPRTASRGKTAITHNQVSLYTMSNDEDPPSSPPPPPRERRSKRKQHESCSEIDETMERLRRNTAVGGDALQLAKLDCVEAPVLQPSRSRKSPRVSKRDKEICLPNLPQVTMTFDELNGLIKRKGGTPICNLEMDEQEIAGLTPNQRPATSIVRQARRRTRTRENPNLELRAQQPPGSLISKDLEFASLDSSLVPLQRMQRKVYSGSEDESPRAEIQIKMEATTMRTVCRPTKRSAAQQVMSNLEPMRALPMSSSGLKQSLEAINQTMGQTVLPRLKLDYQPEADDGDNYTSDLNDDPEVEEADLMSRAAKLIERSRSDSNPGEQSEEDEQEEEEEEAVLKLPPLTKQNSNVSRRLVLLEQDENGTMYIKSAPSAKRRSTSGLLGDKYDPFLSAKRQLEELCSPSTPPPEEEVVTTSTTRTLTPLTTATTTPTATPSNAMTTSLTTKPAQQSTQRSLPASNFRRTSSLRGPRRTPMLNSRPLFATNYRPTIQRGLSDEGPISTNFLKPEEFDEMPVRAACGNDFHSPRVVRRDQSASNRKQLLKLPVGNQGNEATSQTGRSVAKTDSLAVFLKYEHELEQLNAKAAELAVANQLTSKEQKDKSNTLSKQNSAKSLGQSTPTTQLPPLTTLTASAAKEPSYPPVATPLRLEPIGRPAAPLTPIKLESIFGPRRSDSGSGSAASDFIDPKLINACDNLHVNSGVSSDASSTPQQLSQQSTSRSSSQSTITHSHTQERRQSSGEARNLLKRKMRLGRNQFLYDASPEDAQDASSGCCSADDEANRSSMEYDEQCWQQQQKQLLANPLLPMAMVHGAMPTFDDFDFEEFLSSFENENDDEQFPLFKDCREFLLNRSTSRQRSFQKAISTTQTTATQPTITPNYGHHHQAKTTKDSHAHRSECNASSEEEKMEKQAAEDQRDQKREIFISIETEANAQGRSPISPESLRHMVGNAQTPIDVLHIENGDEPEHARFSKISDTEEAPDEPGDRASQHSAPSSRLAPSSSGSSLAPNVQLNNAKNMIQRMHSEYRQMGEEASASMRRMLIVGNGSRSEDQEQQQHQQPSRDHRNPNPGGPLTPSPSADSDELSSLDGYPMSSSQDSRPGASSKLSSDSAYGSNSPYSLSRQRSTELQPGTPRSQGLLRPHTASAKLPGLSMSDASTQAQTKYGTLKARQRLFAPECGSSNGNEDGADSSSSGSDNSLAAQSKQQQKQQQQQQQQQTSNYNYQQQQQQQTQSQSQPTYNTNNNNSNNNNNNLPMTPTTSQHSLMSNSSMSLSMKMSKFCHECGAKFIIEHAKFCMDCGVKRVVL
ncbi:uncharacterized protein LOC108144311 isoform X2 [Drosophila elegans]|uniref:uncharacterized protein LOC108144311 isoform X2 n=1 Tax=Drosophila elegans TaxID=30023 RepID=UPI0007E8A8A7|nr:uncharacterized protein LOC108144311 isoform X2 [Drosophila elegans]